MDLQPLSSFTEIAHAYAPCPEVASPTTWLAKPLCGRRILPPIPFINRAIPAVVPTSIWAEPEAPLRSHCARTALY